jgi:hypothetical protein
MKRFNTFGEYMFDLLFGPLKKGKKSVNQFFIFFKVVGGIFDDMKTVLFRVRDEANIVTASPVMLPVHGQDRDMPRLEGEGVEAYRTRLSMKGIIAEEAGTKQGILRALTALGYSQSYIEPFSLQDPDRWAEFIVYLKGPQQSGVNNLAVIDAQVRKVKEASSKPAYGVDAGGVILIRSELQVGLSRYPRCGEIACGVFPHSVSVGHLITAAVAVRGGADSGLISFPKVGTVAASEEFYQPSDFVIYKGFASDIEVSTKTDDGGFDYPRSSPTTYLKGGHDQ